MANGLTIEFRLLPSRRFTKKEVEEWRHYWHNWTGLVPEKDDIVALHFGDDNEEEERCVVYRRVISGTDPDRVVVYVMMLSEQPL